MTDEIDTSKTATFWFLKCQLNGESYYLCQTVIGQRYLSEKLDCIIGDVMYFNTRADAVAEARVWHSQLQPKEKAFRVKPVQVGVCVWEGAKE